MRAADGHERPKLLDFGIAAVAESVTKLTRTRGFLLTPDHAAPEQWLEIAAEKMDGRTDLYALGCVFYEMLTGSTPFHAHNTSGWMKQHLEEIPKPPSLLRPDLASWTGLDSVLLQLLAKEPDQRPQDATELLSLLDAVSHLPIENARRTVVEDTRKPANTIVEKTTPRPETRAETARPQTQLIPESVRTSASLPVTTESKTESPQSRKFPRWAWGAAALLILTAAFTTWRMSRTDTPQIQTQRKRK